VLREDAPGAAAFAEDLFRRFDRALPRAPIRFSSWELRRRQGSRTAATRSKIAGSEKRAKNVDVGLRSLCGGIRDGRFEGGEEACWTNCDDPRPRRAVENSGAGGICKN